MNADELRQALSDIASKMPESQLAELDQELDGTKEEPLDD